MKPNINWKNAIILIIVIDIIIIWLMMLGGCSPGQHHGHIYIHDPNHIEVEFTRPMTMEIERDGIKVKASSMKRGLLEDLITILFLRPR